MWPLCVQLGKTSWKRVSYDSLDLALLYRTPFHKRRWFCSHRNWLNSGGSVSLDCHWPRVPSHSLEMTKLRVGSACWAWCKSSEVIQVNWWLSCTESRMCRSQLYASMGLVRPLRAAFCTAHTAGAVTWGWVLELSGKHPGQDTLDKASVSILDRGVQSLMCSSHKAMSLVTPHTTTSISLPEQNKTSDSVTKNWSTPLECLSITTQSSKMSSSCMEVASNRVPSPLVST